MYSKRTLTSPTACIAAVLYMIIPFFCTTTTTIIIPHLQGNHIIKTTTRAPPSPFLTANALSLSSLEKLLVGPRVALVKEKSKTSFLQKERNNVLCGRGSSSSSSRSGDDDNNHDIVIIFPGAGGPDQFTSELKSSMIRSDEDAKLAGPTRFITVWDWSEHRGSIATAAFDGEAVGEAVAEAIMTIIDEGGKDASSPKLRSVHSIGVSVGGFAANALARRCKEFLVDVPYVRLTLLDPFCSRGVLGVGYGKKNFGLDVDYAEHFLNTDDPVPTTNDALPLCSVVDVTGAKERNDFILPEGETMHCWPLVYYARHFYRSLKDERDGRMKLPRHTDVDANSRGSVVFK